MSAVDINRRIFLKSLNRLRSHLFGNDSLKINGIKPETGETVLAELIVDWSGRRVDSTTDSDKESGSWKFQIAAKDDWKTSQSFLLKAVSLTIGERRWKVTKIEKPVNNAKVWKIKGEVQ